MMDHQQQIQKNINKRKKAKVHNKIQLQLQQLTFCLKMIFTLVNTKKKGKFILHKYPPKTSLQIKNPLPSTQLLDHILQSFTYFGLFHQKRILQAFEEEQFSEKLLTEMFSANEKHTEVVVAVDDCVFVCRSAFIKDHQEKMQTGAKSTTQSIKPFQNSLGQFSNIKNEFQSIIYSLSVVWCCKSFDQVEDIKHKISFLLGVLEHRQQNEAFISSQIDRIMSKQESLIKKIKQKCAEFTKDELPSYDQDKVKPLLEEVFELANQERSQIQLFNFLQRYKKSMLQGSEFSLEDIVWQGTIGQNLIISAQGQVNEDILDKTIITLEEKLEKTLPPILYKNEQRLKKLYNLAFINDSLPLKQVIEKEKDELFKQSILHTVNFLMKNQLAISVYPFDGQRYYNQYTLRQMPTLSQIDKFNTKIFSKGHQQENMLKMIEPFGINHKVKSSDYEKIKYLIFQKILHEVQLYIYQFPTAPKKGDEGEEGIEKILKKYKNTNYDIHKILIREKDISLKDLIEFTKNKKEWRFFCIQPS